MVDGSGDPTTTWKFEPADITVAAGGTVKWHNNGQQPHTVTADDGSFKSSYISPGGDFEQSFPTPGNYAYHCDPHPWMKAVVHVTGGSGAAPAPTTTTAPAPTANTAPTPKQGAAAGATTTTTAKAGASTTTSTTTTTAAGGVTSTTAALGTTPPTTAPATGAGGTDTASTTTTTGANPGGAASESGGSGESAASVHRKTDSGKTDGPLVALAALLTVMLIGISGKLLLSKSRPH